MGMTWDDWRSNVLRQAPGFEAGPLAIALCGAAMELGAKMADGTRYGVKPGEEGLTEGVLIDLCRAVPNLRINKTARKEETEAGTDWEWWIEGASHWFGFLVQAKRVHSGTKGQWHYSLGYRPSPKADGTIRPLQVASLLDTAEALDIPAMYALYNEAGNGLQYTRPQLGPACTVPAGGDGVTAVGAWTVDWLVTARGEPLYVDVDSIAPFAFPWSCLSYCLSDSAHASWPPLERDLPDLLGFDPDNLDDAAYRAARFVIEVERASNLNQFALGTLEGRAVDFPLEVERVARAVRQTPPEYAVADTAPVSDDRRALPEVEHPLAERGSAPRYVATLSAPQWLRDLRNRTQ